MTHNFQPLLLEAVADRPIALSPIAVVYRRVQAEPLAAGADGNMIPEAESRCVSTSSSARLIVVCGLPGAGKTMHAEELVADDAAIRLSADEWMDRLGVDLWDERTRENVERLQWELAHRLLQLDQTGIIEWGTWSREEREALRRRALELRAATELHYTHAPVDVLFARVRARAAENPPITLGQLRGRRNSSSCQMKPR